MTRVQSRPTTKAERARAETPPLADAPSFIEVQFPVAKVSMESYKERKAGAGQTLTGLGKWWGRKPLVLVRAVILGLLLPATDDPATDREVFLRLMTMDPDGLWLRRNRPYPFSLAELWSALPPARRERIFDMKTSIPGNPKYLKGLPDEVKEEAHRFIFDRLTYQEKLERCNRPEEIEGPSPESWEVINRHLGTKAASIGELVEELGIRRFGHRPRVGDSFCGAGSIPFEAARIGCDAYGSDLNPVAALLTWAALNIVGGGPEVAERVQKAQREIFEAVDRQITEWGIEHNERGWRADAYLYCVDVTCPECKWKVPLAPSWVIAEKTNVVAKLIPDAKAKRFEIVIEEGVDAAAMEAARRGTVANSELICPNGCQSHDISFIRGDGRGGLRQWENHDVVPREGDVFGERLYCIRWVETYVVNKKGEEVWKPTSHEPRTPERVRAKVESGEYREKTRRHYLGPDEADLARERKALDLLMERFDDWQARGIIPSRRIEPGAKTNEPIRTRGWTHWHHLFTPRQLLMYGFMQNQGENCDTIESVACVLLVCFCANWNSRLNIWNTHRETIEQTFANQALNTLCNYSTRGVLGLENIATRGLSQEPISTSWKVEARDSRVVTTECDFWITDPPYADAVRYDEISEFFLVFQENVLERCFSGWYTDSKRSLAIRGDEGTFSKAMVECYRSLTRHTRDRGLQVVMFTHQDASVWADLALIVWSAGLHVIGGWCIATETNPGIKEGNYVQGTVLLILRKRGDGEPVFLDELWQDVESEVRSQLSAMIALDDESDPNFGDADYNLAAYAAALRVLTANPIKDIDPEKELLRERVRGEKSKVETVIENAVRIACDHLVPKGIKHEVWKDLAAHERFYVKGLEVESHGEHRSGVYQELARGYGARDYTDLLASTKANETRLKTPREFGKRQLGGKADGFGRSLVRQVLFAIHVSRDAEDTRAGLVWLHDADNVPDYWASRSAIHNILVYVAALGMHGSLEHWHADAEAARLLAGAVENDHV